MVVVGTISGFKLARGVVRDSGVCHAAHWPEIDSRQPRRYEEVKRQALHAMQRIDPNVPFTNHFDGSSTFQWADDPALA
jgi:hypothetical protein